MEDLLLGRGALSALQEGGGGPPVPTGAAILKESGQDFIIKAR